MAILLDGTIVVPIQPNIVELRKNRIPLLGALPKWQTSDELLKWNANIGGATATGEAVTSDVTTFSDDEVDPASLTIAQHRIRSSFQILETKFTAAQARGQDELVNLISYSGQAAVREIFRSTATALITGTGNAASGEIIGFNTEAGAATANAGTPGKNKTTNAYAGIDPTTKTLWTNLVYTSMGALTRKKLRDFEVDLIQGVTTGSPGTYTHLIMSPATATAYMEAFNLQYTQVATEVNPARRDIDLGYGMLMYNGAPVLEDISVPDGEIHFVDLNEVRLYSFNQAEGEGMSEERPTDGLLLYVKGLPSNNPQNLKFAMFGMFQLQVRSRNAHSVIRGVTL